MFKRKLKNDEISFQEALLLFSSSIKRVWQYDKKYVVLTCFVLILGTIPDLLAAFAGAIFNQRLILGAEMYASYLYAYYPLLISFFAAIINGVFFCIWRWIETKASDMINTLLLRESVRKTSKIDFASYDDSKFYDMLQKGWAQDGKAFVGSATVVFNSISNIISLGAYISILAFVDWKLTLVFTLLRILVNPLTNKHYVWTCHLNNKLAEIRRKEQYHRNFFVDKAMASEGKIYNLYDYAEKNFLKAHKDIYRATFIHKIKINALNLFAIVISELPLAVTYIYLSVCVYNGTVSLANMTLFISIQVGFIDQIYITISDISGFRGYAEKTRYAREFMTLPTRIITDDDHIKECVSQSAEGHTVEFRNVTFRYPGKEKNILENISFRVGKNETVSIIGANGAGKTTLIHLLIRLYDPTEGTILLDGKNIREYSVESLYGIYGVLFQDYCNYAVNAKESIALSTEATDYDKIDKSLKFSTAYKFVNELKKGIDTPLSRKFDQNGTELSVGQKQRIALARVYYKDAPVIVLDEPSASIDPESEAEILDAVNDMRGKRNIWLVSHRLSTCVISDRILLLKNGMLIGNGTHNDLIRNNEEYQRMFKLQADRYEVSE